MPSNCPSCDHNGGDRCNLFGKVIGMHICPYGEKKHQTNADKIRSMTDEEMAEEIVLLFCRFPLDYEKLLEYLRQEATSDG